jgi:hypothetical protein
MRDDLSIDAKRGAPFVLGRYDAFGVVLSVNGPRGVAFVMFQNGTTTELPLQIVSPACAMLDQYRIDS